MEKAGCMSRQTVLPRVVFPGRLASAGARSSVPPGCWWLMAEGKRYCIRLSQASSNCCWPAAHSNKTSLFGRFFPILFEQENYNLSFKRNKMSCPTSEGTLENTKTEIHVLKNQVSFWHFPSRGRLGKGREEEDNRVSPFHLTPEAVLSSGKLWISVKTNFKTFCWSEKLYRSQVWYRTGL